MATLARDIERFIPSLVTESVNVEEAWAAFERRDRSWDGRVIGAVKTTGIYCKPSCPARRPKRSGRSACSTGSAWRTKTPRAFSAWPSGSKP